MTTYSWKTPTSGDWGSGGLWTPAGVPNSTAADAVINIGGTYTVTLAANESFFLDTLTLANGAATVQAAGTLKLGGAVATLAINSGTFIESGVITGGTIAVAGGTFELAASLAYAGTLIGGQSGTVALAAGTTLSLSGATRFANLNTYGSVVTGPGTLSTTGSTTLAAQVAGYVDMYLAGGATWLNSGSVSIGGRIDFGANPAETASFVNLASGTLNLINDFAGIVYYTSYDTATLRNAGLLEKSGGTGISSIYAAVTNTGSILVSTGTLEIDAGGSFGGAISGGGTIAFNAGTSTLTTNIAANVLIEGGTTQIASARSMSAGFSLTHGVLSLASGSSLRLGGAATFGGTNAYGATISGPGTITTAGATTMATQTAGYVDVYIGGGATWVNSGNATIGGLIDFGAAPADSGFFINQAGGTLNLIDDFASIVPYTSYDNAKLSNAGLLEKSGGTATSAIYATVTNTGTIIAASGTLEFDGGGSFGGSLSGAGTIAFGGGSSTLNAGSFAVANVLIDGGALVLARSIGSPLTMTTGTLEVAATESITGAVSFQRGLVKLDAGTTLRLSNARGFGISNNYGVVITGPGTLATAGAATLATQTAGYVDLYLGGGASWINSGNVTVGGQIDFGANPAETASFANLAGSIFNLIDDFSGIVAYTSYDNASFANAGLLEKTGGVGVSTIAASMTNTGSILIGSGTLQFTAGGSFGGAISGAGTIAFAAGVTTLTASITSNVLVNGGTLAVAASETVAGAFTGTSGTLALAAGATLKLSSTASFDVTSGYGPTISGPGTLNTTGATTLATQSAGYVDLYVAGGATWVNSGNATIGGIVDIGTAVADSAAFVNTVGSTFNLVSDLAGLQLYTSYVTGTFANAGLFEKTGGTGTGTSTIGATFTNTGSILVGNGTLQFNAGGSFGGSISGTGTIAFAGGVATLNAGSFGVGNVLIDGGNLVLARSVGAAVTMTSGTLEVAATESISGAATFSRGVVTLDAGTTLRLGGTNAFDVVNNYGPIVIGPGTLSTTGATTLATQSAGYVDLYLGGGATWLNSGSVTVGGIINFGANPAETASFVNAAGGTFNLIDDQAGLVAYSSYDTATFANAGVLEKTGGSATSSVTATVTNTGSIIASAGTLSVPNLTNLSGTTLTGGTYVATAGAALQFANNTTITTAAAQIVLSGIGSAMQAFNTSSSSLVSIDSTLFNVTSAGALRILGGRSFTVVANAGSLIDNGQVQLGGGTLNASKVLIGTSGTLLGNGLVAATISSGGALIARNGGTLALTGAIFASSALEADAGSVLQINLAAPTSVTGRITLNGVGSKIQFGKIAPFTLLETTLTSIAATGTFSVLGNRGYVTTKALTDSGVFAVGGGTFTAASVSVAAGGRIAGFGTFTNAVADSGTIEANGGLLKLAAGATGAGAMVVDAASTLELAAATTAGAITDNGTLLLDGATTTTSGLTVGATGIVSGHGVIAGKVSNAGQLAAVGGTLSVTGSLSDTGTLNIAAGATLAASAGGAISGSVIGTGTLALSGTAGFTTTGALNVGSAVINAANVSVGSGPIAFLGAVTNNATIAIGANTASFSRSLAGTGTVTIGAAGTASLLAGSAATETINFLASSGTLDLGTPLSFAGKVGGFVVGDKIDLLSTIATGKSFAGGVLTVTNGATTVASLHFNGTFTTASFNVGTDGHGGTLITHA